MNRAGRSHRVSGRALGGSLLLSAALAAGALTAPALARPARNQQLRAVTEQPAGGNHSREHGRAGEKGTAKSPREGQPGGWAAQLWATVDVCNAADQPGAIGIRGSMPGDGHSHDIMWMDFEIQYLNSETGEWENLSKEGESGWQRLGSAALTRQAGRTFQFQLPTPQEGTTFTLRGLVSFQWRHGSRIMKAITRITTAGHKSLAGADPPGYSAATCSMS